MKNDITYEYRVFTNRLIDVEDMEVGKCTSKVIEELKPKDKVDGRFFHTSDTDEWFFCWNGKLQKLNLKGDSDVNAALEEVKKLIGEANTAVEDAKEAASEAKTAADAASAAVESIDSKADKTAVDALSSKVDLKADSSAVTSLSEDIKELSGKVALKSDLEGVVKTSELDGYATEEFVKGEIDEIKVPTKVSELVNDSKYLTDQSLGNYYTKDEIEKKIGDISDLIGDATTYITNTILA